MADIRKRIGAKGTTYQVRYPSKAAKSGYAFATFATRKEALEFRDNSRTRRSDTPKHAEHRTVSQGVKLWLNICEKEGLDGREPVTKYTLANYKYYANIYESYAWDKALQELTKPDMVKFRSWLLQNYSREVSHKALAYFHSMVLELVSRQIVAHDFAAGVSVSSTSRYDEPVSIPTEREIDSLLSAADKLANSKNILLYKTWQRYRPILYLAVDSGMRPQEYLVAAKSDLRDEGFEVTRALDGSGKEITVPKTRAGRRLIDLDPDVVGMIRHYADNHAVPNKHDLLFPCKNGSWIKRKHWSRHGFERVCEEAGLMISVEENGKVVERPKYRPYDLRHFYASILIDDHVNPKRVQKLMGHEDIRTTLNVYGHLIERAEASKREKTSGLKRVRRSSCGESVAI